MRFEDHELTQEQIEHLEVVAHKLGGEDASSRRDLLRRAGLLAGSAILGGGLLGSSKVARAQAGDDAMAGDQTGTNGGMMNGDTMNGDTSPMPNVPPVTVAEVKNPGAREQNDIEILNFALGLEYLEADFYNRVVQADEARAFLRGRPKDIARVLARDENMHAQVVADAITRLGGTPIGKPTFQFPAAAFVSQIAFLELSATLEETGVSAYSGQGPRVKRKDVLDFAASIYGNECRHTGMIRYLLGDSIAPRDMELPQTMAQIMTRVKPFILSMPDAPAAAETSTM